MSFYTSLTGLNAASAQLSIASNNVANVGTVGFKKSRAEFGDIFATSPLENASSAIGQGVLLKKVTQQFSQGNIEFSSNSLDLAISGQGFFALKPSLTSNSTVYTRAGSFSVNNDRYVVDSSGQYLQVFPVNDDGSVIATGLESARSLQLPQTAGLPKPTTKIELGLNLPAGAEIIPQQDIYSDANPYRFDRADGDTFNKSTSITVYDSLGNPHIATIYYVKTSSATEIEPTNKWNTHIFIGDEELEPALISAKNDKGETMYMNKFGQISTDPSAADPTFNAEAAHPMYFQDEQNQEVPSERASVKGGYMAGDSGFDFGSTDSSTVTIHNKESHKYYDFTDLELDTDNAGDLVYTMADGTVYTRAFTTDNATDLAALAADITAGEANITASAAAGFLKLEATDGLAMPAGTLTITAGDVEAAAVPDTSLSLAAGQFSGENFVTISVDGSEEQAITVEAGSYTGTELATELTRRINEKFGDDKNFVITADSNDKFTLKTDDGSGTNTSTVAVTLDAGTYTLETLLQELRDKIASTDGTAVEGGTAIDTGNITVDYDLKTRSFTFISTDDTQDKVKAYMTTGNDNDLTLSTLGIPGAESETSFSADGEMWTGSQTVPNGTYILDPKQHRSGIEVKYLKDARKFQFYSGSTSEDAEIKIHASSYDQDGTETTTNVNHLLGLGDLGETDQYLDEYSISNVPIGAQGDARYSGTGSGLAASQGVTVGDKAGVDITGTFSVTESNDENVINITVDGIVGQVVVPPSAYTGDTFAESLQDRINLVENADGQKVTGVTVEFDAENQRFKFTSGTSGDKSFININGHSNWGLDQTSQTRGAVPNITVLQQATDAEGNLLYIDRDGQETTVKPDSEPNWVPIYLDKGELTYDTFGKLISPKEGAKYTPFDPNNGSDLIQLNVDYGKFSTQYSAPFSVLSLSQDGFPSGRLDGLDIDSGGVIRANYTNGQQEALGKLILTNFANPNGLKQVGNANYVATTNSGNPTLGEAGADGFGTIQGGALERANVDLTEELVNLITAQRNFQANAKAIETSSALTSTIINIRG